MELQIQNPACVMRGFVVSGLVQNMSLSVEISFQRVFFFVSFLGQFD